MGTNIINFIPSPTYYNIGITPVSDQSENTKEMKERYKKDVGLGGRASRGVGTRWGLREKTAVKWGVFETSDSIQYDNTDMTYDEATVDKFVIKCLVVSNSEQKEGHIEKQIVFEIFEKFCDLNDVQLQQLDPSRAASNRQGELADIITELTGVETGRPSDHETRTPSYYNIGLTRFGLELYQLDDEVIKQHSEFVASESNC